MTDLERAILNMEGRDWRTAARKEDVIRRELDMSVIAYYQALNALIDTQAALEYVPTVVNRLRRLRRK